MAQATTQERIPMREIQLTQQNAVDADLLVPPSERTLGGEPDIEMDSLRLRIGDRPVVRNLRALYELGDRKIPADLEVFISYEIWLLTHVVSVIKEGGFSRVRRLGYEVRFRDKPKVTVLDVLPQTHFVTRAGGSLRAEGDLEINGQMSVPDSLVKLLDRVDALSLGGKLTFATQVNIVGRLGFSVMTPVIVAVGAGSNGSEWVFTKDERPLLGDQLMIQTLLTPPRLRKLHFRARMYAVVSSFNLVPARLQSDWLDLECAL